MKKKKFNFFFHFENFQKRIEKNSKKQVTLAEAIFLAQGINDENGPKMALPPPENPLMTCSTHLIIYDANILITNK